MKILFGEKCKPLPKLYIPENLEHLVNVINLPESPLFGSYKDIIEKMSIFPLYDKFMSNDPSKGFSLFIKENAYKAIEHKYRLRIHGYLEGEPRIKFCKDCFKEDKVVYLNREHQIQGNVICYKHKSILQYVKFNTEKRYDLNIDIQRIIKESEYCISENDERNKIFIHAAEIIHSIFTNKLTDSINVIKSKIRKRLRDQGYMQYNYFPDVNIFFDDFKFYNLAQITYKQLFHILFTTSQEESPIAYISLIVFLFKDLNYFNRYELSSEDLIDIKYNKREYNHIFRSSYGERMSDEYTEYLRKKFGDKFKVISINEDILSIKHNLCGDVTEINKKDYRNIKTCMLCKQIELNNKYRELVKQISNDYVFLGVNAKKQSISLRHKKCYKEFSMNYFNFLNGRECNFCKKLAQYRKRIKDVFGDEYIVLDYTTYLKKARYIHNIPSCMGEIVIKPKQFIKLKYCPCCLEPKTSISNNSIVHPWEYVGKPRYVEVDPNNYAPTL
jgi:hypothetical protein